MRVFVDSTPIADDTSASPQDKNKNKATGKHSKKEKPGKEFLFPTVFAFSVIPGGRSEGVAMSFRAEVRRTGVGGICLQLLDFLLRQAGYIHYVGNGITFRFH